MNNGKPNDSFKRAWVKHYLDWYTRPENLTLSPGALHTCGYLTALAGRCWDGVSEDCRLMFGRFPATVVLLGDHSRWGPAMDLIIQELAAVGFLRVEDNGIYVVNFKRWQARRTESVQKTYGRKKKEERSKKREVRGQKLDGDTARAWARLAEVRKELIPGSRSTSLPMRGRAAISARISEHGIDAVLAVIEHRANEVRRDPSAAKWLQWETIFRPRNFDRTLGMIGTGQRTDTTLHVRREDYGPAGEVAL